MRLKLRPRSANSSLAGDGNAMRQVAFGKLRSPAQKLGQGGAQAAQQQDRQRQRGENGERGVDLADALEPVQELCSIGIDSHDFGGLVRHGDFDQLVELLIDAVFGQLEQILPGDIRPAAVTQLFHLAELIQGLLKLPLDRGKPLKLGGFALVFLGPHQGQLPLGEVLQCSEVGLDDLVQIGGAQRLVAHAR